MSREKLEKDFEECSQVFVYGSLKEGEWNNRILSSSSKLTTTVTADLFIMGDVGFPYSIPEEHVPEELTLTYLPVEGEVWEVDDVLTFMSLDALEGEGHHYHREMREMQDGTEVWMYVQRDWQVLYQCTACEVTEDNNYIWKGNTNGYL